MLSSVFTFPVLCLLVLTAVHLSVSQLTDQQKQDLLDLHNRARSMVDPIATNMEEMEWNDELAAVAQAFSTNCSAEQPNPDRSSQAPSFTTVGENSGVSMPPSNDSYSQVVGLWFDGRVLYNYTTGMCFRDQFCDAYTQLVWATSNQVGCGATVCSSVGGFPSGRNGLVLICNYGPAGNLEGQSPYMTGASSCFNCPDNKRSCVNNLCSNGNATIVTPTSSAVIMATSSATINPTATNVATPTPSTGGDMDGSSCKIYQSVLLVLTLAVISVTIL